MASREELQLIREARARNPKSQYELGKLYLFGSKSLPKSMATAMHWLSQSSYQNNMDAKAMIAKYIPFDMVKNFPDRQAIEGWYRDVYAAGNDHAGLTLAKLLLAANTPGAMQEAVLILEAVNARSDIAEAQWLLAELQKNSKAKSTPENTTLKLTARAAGAGILEAKLAMIERAWDTGDFEGFAEQAIPIARSLVQSQHSQGDLLMLPERYTQLLLRCGLELLKKDRKANIESIQSMWEMAAKHKNAEAAYLLGLWYARMDENGNRTNNGAASTSFKKSIRFLTQAGKQQLAKAWYALSLIYQKAEFSQRSIADAQRFLEHAANLGHPRAQFERGMHAWRNRRDDETSDIHAIYWLQKAAGNGENQANELLDKIAFRAKPALWAQKAMAHISQEDKNSHPFLAARIELASVFGLSRPETLLLDINSADKGHCLLVDIRRYYRRSRRKLILIQSGEERQILSRIVKRFEQVDCGPSGPEGNYRQRQYRLKTMVPTEILDLDKEAD